MKVLVTGSQGQLGRTLLARCPDGIVCVGIDKDDVDVCDADAIGAFVAAEQPDVIVNAAAYTAVDLAESEPELARRVNVDGAANLARYGVRMIQVSTDFVFDGAASEAYAPDAATGPLGVYAQTKLEGEYAVLEALGDRAAILRTAWLYSEYGGNFVATMLRLMHERDELAVVNDQVGSPTWARSVADAIFAMIARPALAGVYHWTDGGQASWHEFACAIQAEAIALGQLDKEIDIRPIPSSEYPVAARRPAYSVLDCASTAEALGLEQAPWRYNLRAMLKEGTP